MSIYITFSFYKFYLLYIISKIFNLISRTNLEFLKQKTKEIGLKSTLDKLLSIKL